MARFKTACPVVLIGSKISYKAPSETSSAPNRAALAEPGQIAVRKKDGGSDEKRWPQTYSESPATFADMPNFFIFSQRFLRLIPRLCAVCPMCQSWHVRAWRIKLRSQA